MNIYEKAVAGLALAGHDASVIQQSAEDIGVWLDNVWNDDLQHAFSFRIHDEEITWWAFYYDEQQNEKQ